MLTAYSSIIRGCTTMSLVLRSRTDFVILDATRRIQETWCVSGSKYVTSKCTSYKFPSFDDDDDV